MPQCRQEEKKYCIFHYLTMYKHKNPCGFCSFICFIVPMYTNMDWNPAAVDLDCKHNNNCSIYPRCMDDQYSYFEETVTCNRKVNLKILENVFMLKKSSIAFASTENIVASSWSLEKNTSLLITAAAATLFLSFKLSV